MECRASMKHVVSPLLFLLLCVQITFAAGAEDRRLLLVTDSASGVASLSKGEIRRLFLGLPVEKGGHLLKAAVNRSDPLLYEVFLQKIVGMSSIVYERHLLANVIQIGVQRPQVFTDTPTLISALKRNRDTVTVLWDGDLRATPNLTVIGELWHNTTE